MEHSIPFSPSALKAIQDWRSAVVITDPNAFQIGAPTSIGKTKPYWGTDAHGNEVVIKTAGGFAGIAREKIAADLAQLLGLPVPPVCIWVKPSVLNGGDEYYAVSLRAYAGSVDSPSPDRIKTDPVLPAIAIFDAWIGNQDRTAGNMVHDGQGSPLAYIDHERTLGYWDWYFEKLNALRDPKLWEWPKAPIHTDDKVEWEISDGIEKRTLNEIKTPGSIARHVLRQIQYMSDDAIAGIVNAVPDRLYNSEQKDTTIRMLRARRDLLREMFPPTDDYLMQPALAAKTPAAPPPPEKKSGHLQSFLKNFLS